MTELQTIRIWIKPAACGLIRYPGAYAEKVYETSVLFKKAEN